jgi:hypothetical protein
MARSGVRHVEVNAVDDNLLWRPADPVLIGYAAAAGAAAAAKVVEPAAVRPAYAAAAAAAAAGGAGSVWEAASRLAPGIGVYYFSARALERLSEALTREPLAGARLAPAAGVPKLPPRGGGGGGSTANSVPPPLPAYLPPAARARALAAAAAAAEAAAAPRPVDGYVLTRGLGEALRAGEVLPPGSVALLGVARDEEFATVWGRGPHWLAPAAAAGDAGGCSGGGGALAATVAAVPAPGAGAARLLALTTAWVRAAGGRVVRAGGPGGVEVSPLASYAGEGLEALCAGVEFTEPAPKALAGARRPPGRPRHNAGGWGAPLAVAYAGALAAAARRALLQPSG